MSHCFYCQETLKIFLEGKVQRSDQCSKCSSDLRVCKNCVFYDPSHQWECKEHIQENVKDKEKANFCDYFQLRQNSEAVKGGDLDKSSEAKKAAEALFKK